MLEWILAKWDGEFELN